MKKIIFLEGLPGVGKTTMVNAIKKLEQNDLNTVDEITNDDNFVIGDLDQSFFMRNDEMKINKYSNGTVIIDRGFISTLSYNQTKEIINHNHSCKDIRDWFEKNKDIYLSDNVYVYYLTNKQSRFHIPYINEEDPYGSVENQKLLESISLFNINKYVKNYKIIEYYQENMEEVIDEIIN